MIPGAIGPSPGEAPTAPGLTSSQADWVGKPKGTDDGSAITVTGDIRNGDPPAAALKQVSIHWTALDSEKHAIPRATGSVSTSPANIEPGKQAGFRIRVNVTPTSTVSEVDLTVFVAGQPNGMHAEVTF